MKNSITVKHTVFINATKEAAWDFTQDYSKRTQWDGAVLEAEVIQSSPRIVRLKTKGNTSMIFVYKQDDRPDKTSLAAADIQSPFILSAGGSWLYETKDNGTLWTQKNTIILKPGFLYSMLLPFLKWMFSHQTKSAMEKAKKIIGRI